VTYDIAIIGGGPGGYVAAICGARQGLKTVLIEKDTVGGTCLNRGCVPTKSFYYDSNLFKSATTSSVLRGAENLSIDAAKMVARKQQVVKNLVSGLEKTIKSNDVTIIQGFGELISSDRIRITDTKGKILTVNARHIILATGSRPAVPSFVEIDGHWVQTTDEALDSEDIPKKVVIIGGGVIGLEMAAIYLNLGSQVVIVELLPDIIMTEDPDIRGAMRMLLEQRGAVLYLNAHAQRVAVSDVEVSVTVQTKTGQIQSICADRLLIATGRKPVLDGIDAANLGLKIDGSFVKVNSWFETSLPNVYAIGDLVGGMMLAHKATAEAEAVIASILGDNKTVRPEWIPRCIWGLAEVGAVGLTEEQARELHRNITIGKFPFSASGAAQAMGHTAGMVKIVGDAESGEILGVHIIGAHATDLISEAVTAMAMEGAVEDLYEAVKPHPTVSETVLEAALDWSGRAIHMPRKK
jgi:dihydrolipoamide dehydrogenase